MISLLDSGKVIGSNVSIKQLARECLPVLPPSPISLRALIKARGCPLSRCVRLHLKVLTPPPNISIATMLASMRLVYKTAGIRVVVASRERLTGPAFTMLDDLDIQGESGPCQEGEVSPEQAALFMNRNHVREDEIAIYFVNSTVPAFNGCAAHPDGLPSAVIASVASRWTLAHEVGHVLELAHIAGEGDDCQTPDFTRLMTGCGTAGIAGTPTLGDMEIFVMKLSGSVSEC